MSKRTTLLAISCALVCLVGVFPGVSPVRAADAVNTLVSPDLFGETVDLVTPGFIHWSKAAGDTVDPDGDDNDFDDNFGEHSGSVTNPKFSAQASAYGAGSVAEHFAFAYGKNTVQWEFKVPGGGEYIIATRLWCELQERTAAIFSYRSGDKWIDLPKIDEIGHWGGKGKLVCFLIKVPDGQKTVPVRVRAASGRVLIFRVLLGRKQEGDPFITGARPTHPSMHFHARDIGKMRQRVKSGPPKLAHEYMLNAAEGYIAQFHRKDNKWTARTSGHHVGRALAQTAFSYVMTGKERYYRETMQMVATVMSWKHSTDATTGGYSILTRGRNLSMVALIYDWFYQKMPASDRDRIRRFMVAEANRLYLYNETGFSVLDSGNWDPWIGAGYAMVGIALKDEHKWTGAWIESMKQIFHANLTTSGENFGYFNNGFTKGIDFGICLKTATGEDVFEPHADRLRALLDYRMMLLSPDGRGYPAFGDARSGNDPLLALVAATYLRDPLGQWFIRNLSCRDLQQVRSWGWNHMMPVAVVTVYDPTLKDAAPGGPRLPLARSFANDPKILPGLSAVTIMRTGYDRPGDVQLTIRCGPFFGWHNHPDQGSFILKAYGDTLTVDVARGGTYGSGPSNFSKTAPSHTQVLIDGHGQITHSAPVYYDHRAGITGPLTHTAFVDYVLAESSVAYAKNPKIKNVKHADRHFIFVRRPGRNAYIVLIDDVQKDDSPRAYDWLLQTGAKKTVEKVAANHNVIRGAAEMDVVMVEPAGAQFTTSEHFNFWRTLKVSAPEKTARGTFMTVLYPRAKGTRSPRVKRLAGDGYVGAAVGERETFLFAKTDSPIEAGGIRTDAKIAALAQKGPAVAWALIVGGTRLEVNGNELLKADKPVTAALNAARDGSVTCKSETRITISIGAGDASVLTLAPGTTTLKRGRK